ncbi:sugar ABC transporter substrate-binding protein [Isoptericola aurantiacus]|uniref:sugar ABC transporter substrate-binding protein n=1 Tax=Isoptericola aurantiacus TaxID=3377839 RepID=UPI00383BF47A
MRRNHCATGAASAAAVVLCLSACSGQARAGDDTLVVTDTMSATSAPIYEEIYDACAAEVGMDVQANHVAGSGLIATVLQQASSRTLPDVLMLDNPDVQQIASSGALSPLTDHSITGAGYPEGVLDAGTYDGDLYGIAPVVNTIGLFYDVDALDEAGIEPPSTWDELREAAAALTEGDRYGIAFSATNTFEGTWQFLPFLWSNGGSEDDLAAPEAVESLEFVDDLVDDGSASSGVVNWSQNDVNDQFIAGKAAMMVNGPWNMPSLEEAEGLDYSSVPLPVPEEGDTLLAPLGGEAFTVPDTGNPDKMASAGAFVECVTTGKNQLTMATGRGAVPADSDVAAEAARENPTVATFVDSVQTARARTALLGPDWPQAATQIYTAEQLALTDTESPADALERVAAQD